ncbi:MAG: hypothetical protein KGK30_10030, partial [Elusimicrobia bacterium]|nr:hypothetical protein [Elusimicrobiota bacterium]
GVALGPHGGASLSLGLGQRGTAMMTVYRLGPKMIRFRLRLDHARFRDASGQVVASIPAVHLFAQPAGALKGLLDNAVAGELARYLAATFGVFSQSSDGEQLVLEFILDPTRPRDMERLSAILRGDFLSLAGMARQMAGLRMTPSRVQKVYAELKAVDEARLGLKARLPAVDLYHDRSHSVHLKVPVLFEQNVSAVTADDEIILRDRQGGRFRLFRADKTSSEAFGDVPFVGQYSKHSLQRSAQAFVYTGRDGRTGPPQAVYIQQEAFARQSAYDVRRMGEDINAIMRLAGSRGGRANPRLEIPLGRLLPLPESSFGSQEAFPNYRDGGFSLTVVLTQRAVADILKAPADLVVRCFANSLGS